LPLGGADGRFNLARQPAVRLDVVPTDHDILPCPAARYSRRQVNLNSLDDRA
jgi:hypothetical protein